MSTRLWDYVTQSQCLPSECHGHSHIVTVLVTLCMLFVLYFLLLVFSNLVFTYMLYSATQPFKLAARVFNKISQSISQSHINKRVSTDFCIDSSSLFSLKSADTHTTHTHATDHATHRRRALQDLSMREWSCLWCGRFAGKTFRRQTLRRQCRTFRRHIQLHKDRIPRHRHPRRHPRDPRGCRCRGMRSLCNCLCRRNVRTPAARCRFVRSRCIQWDDELATTLPRVSAADRRDRNQLASHRLSPSTARLRLHAVQKYAVLICY